MQKLENGRELRKVRKLTNAQNEKKKRTANL
jgi:hypothetical protein